MRILSFGLPTLLIALALHGIAHADLLKAVRPGVMCASADALAKLILHNGGSRSAGPGALPKYQQVATNGGCIPLREGMIVATKAIRKNTSIVTYYSPDGMSDGTYYIPNIDFARFTPPHTQFYKEIRRKCPRKLDGIYVYDKIHLVDVESLFIATLPKPVQNRIAAAVAGQCGTDQHCDYRATANEEARLHLGAAHADFLCALKGFPSAGAG